MLCFFFIYFSSSNCLGVAVAVVKSLEIEHTNVHYLVLGTSTAAIFFSNYHSLFAAITSDECHT